jgi:uncharacterized protein (TIGR02117 family)
MKGPPGCPGGPLRCVRPVRYGHLLAGSRPSGPTRGQPDLRTAARRIGLGFAIVAALLLVAALATARRGDRSLWPPAPGAPATEVFVVSHGYHAGIIVPRAALAATASRQGLAALGTVAARFAGFDRLEIGWGDEGFYREVPTAQSLTVVLALRALFRPGNLSVLHVVGVGADARAAFPNSDLVRLDLGEAGFARLADKLDGSFARGEGGLPVDLGPGLYGTSLFFRANGAFHLFNVCNHWLAGLLDAAGVPTAPVPATLPYGLLLDLEWRSGLARLPAPPLKP